MTDFTEWAFPELSKKPEDEKPEDNKNESPKGESSEESSDEIEAEDADWMKKLPGYQNEVAIHEELAKRHQELLAKGEVDKFGQPIKKS